MIFNIDIDNTVNDFLTKFVLHINAIGANIDYDSICEYNLHKATGIPQNTLEALFYRNNYFYKSLVPLDGSINTIRDLISDGHVVRFVTAITYDVITARVEFIQKYFPFVDPNKSLIVTDHKESIYADVVIDDCANNMRNINPDCKFILFNHAWNQFFEVDGVDHFRCYSWHDIYNRLNKMGYFTY